MKTADLDILLQEGEGGITKTLKIRQIEPEFMSRMFAVEDV